MLHSITIILLDENCFIPGFLTNLEYASCPAILQVTCTLILILAVFILKKMRFSQVIGVEQNLNNTRVFNSAFTYGPGICMFLCFTTLTLMSSKRMFPLVKSDHQVGTLSSKYLHKNNYFIDLFSVKCSDETAFSPDSSDFDCNVAIL